MLLHASAGSKAWRQPPSPPRWRNLARWFQIAHASQSPWGDASAPWTKTIAASPKSAAAQASATPSSAVGLAGAATAGLQPRLAHAPTARQRIASTTA